MRIRSFAFWSLAHVDLLIENSNVLIHFSNLSHVSTLESAFAAAYRV